MIVFEFKACSLPYFLDEMKEYEIKTIMDSLEYTYKNEWEQTRFVSYVVAQTQSTKSLDLTDILHFNWDKEMKEKGAILTKEDVNRLSNKIYETSKKMKEQNNG